MKTKDSTPPTTTPHYIVAKNGIFLHKENWWMKAVVPVKQIAVLEEQALSLRLMVSPISAVVLMKSWRFFQTIYEKYNSESVVLLHYSQELGWEITIPSQKVSFSHVDYIMTDRIPGYLLMGTMHSHSSMSAFHSGTDIGDEAQVDGIHITFGNLDEKETFSLDPEVVVNGTRFVLPLAHMEGMTSVVNPPATSGVFFVGMRTCQKYTIICPELKELKTPQDWIAKVERKVFLSEKLTSTVVFSNPSNWQRPETGTKVPVMADENPAAGIKYAPKRKRVRV